MTPARLPPPGPGGPPGSGGAGGIAAEIRRSVQRLVDGATKQDRRLRRSILVTLAFLVAWAVITHG